MPPEERALERGLSHDVTGLDDLKGLAACIARLIKPGELILLKGDLGAGKTTFVRLLAGLLGIDERQVTSPTFALVHHYRTGDVSLIHADMYRLGPGGDISDLGLYDYLTGDDIVVIEWAEYLEEDLGLDGIELHLEIAGTDPVGSLRRRAHVRALGAGWAQRLTELEKCLSAKVPR
jgi:tRNA threonylcarbamoyladenosine biosynthesis protein TsaE